MASNRSSEQGSPPGNEKEEIQQDSDILQQNDKDESKDQNSGEKEVKESSTSGPLLAAGGTTSHVRSQQFEIAHITSPAMTNSSGGNTGNGDERTKSTALQGLTSLEQRHKSVGYHRQQNPPSATKSFDNRQGSYNASTKNEEGEGENSKMVSHQTASAEGRNQLNSQRNLLSQSDNPSQSSKDPTVNSNDSMPVCSATTLQQEEPSQVASRSDQIIHQLENESIQEEQETGRTSSNAETDAATIAAQQEQNTNNLPTNYDFLYETEEGRSENHTQQNRPSQFSQQNRTNPHELPKQQPQAQDASVIHHVHSMAEIVSSGELRNTAENNLLLQNDPKSVSTGDQNANAAGGRALLSNQTGEGISKFEVLTSPSSATVMSPHVFVTNTDEIQKGKHQTSQLQHTNVSSQQNDYNNQTGQNPIMIQSPHQMIASHHYDRTDEEQIREREGDDRGQQERQDLNMATEEEHHHQFDGSGQNGRESTTYPRFVMTDAGEMIEYYEEEEVYYEEFEEDMEEEIQEEEQIDQAAAAGLTNSGHQNGNPNNMDHQQEQQVLPQSRHVETIQEVDSEHERYSMDTSSNKKGAQFRTTLNTLGSLSPPNETNPFQGAPGIPTGKRTINSSIERRSAGGINSEAKKSAKGKMTLTRDHSRSLGDEPVSLAGSRTGNNSKSAAEETLVFMPSRSLAQGSEELVTLEAKSVKGGQADQLRQENRGNTTNTDFISLTHLSPSGKSSATKQSASSKHHHRVYRVRQRSRISNNNQLGDSRQVHTLNHTSFDSCTNNGNQNNYNASLLKEKLAIMAEKIGIRMVLKEITTRVGQINELFSRKNIQHEMIMSSQNSQMQLKSFLDISMNSNVGAMTEQARRELLSEMSTKSTIQLQGDLSKLMDSFTKQLGDYFQGESEILQSFAKERERNSYLEAEMSRKEDRIIDSGHRSRTLVSSPERPRDRTETLEQAADLAASEQFIYELEAQLQGARSELLGSKLKLSDQQIEIQALNNKLQMQQGQFEQIVDERRNFEQNFENMRNQMEALQSEKLELTQLIRHRESSLSAKKRSLQPDQMSSSGRNNQNSFYGLGSSVYDKQDMQRQIENLNRQVFESTKNQENLKAVENTLLEKLDKKELENLELKQAVNDMQSQVQLKGDVITKAQKIIERLSQKSDQDEMLMRTLNEEKESLRKSHNEVERQCKGLRLQLTEVQNTQVTQSRKMGEAMGKELNEVREALREYQVELETEKSNFSQQVHSLHGQLQLKAQKLDEIEKEATESQMKAQQQIVDYKERVELLSHDLLHERETLKELRAEMAQKIKLVEESAESQIQYLQKRIKEVVEETNQANSLTSVESIKDIARGKLGSNGQILALKQDLEQLSAEVVKVRNTIRDEGAKEKALVNQGCNQFDLFRLQVLDQIILWDEKTAELAALAGRYYGALEEQRKLFSKIKLVVNEKDQVISQLKRQLQMREQSQQLHFDSLKVELKRQNEVVQKEILLAVSLLERKVKHKDLEVVDTQQRFAELRSDFTALLEEKNVLEQKYDSSVSRLQIVEQDYEDLRKRNFDSQQSLASILKIQNKHTGPITDKTLEYAVENLQSESSRLTQENQSLRDRCLVAEKATIQDTLDLRQIVSDLESQKQVLERENHSREEILKSELINLEEKLGGELKQAKLYSEKVSAEAATRERQLRKIQDKIEDGHRRATQMEDKVDILSREKNEEIRKQTTLKSQIVELEATVAQKDEIVDQKQKMLEMLRKEVTAEKKQLSERDIKIQEFELKLSDEQKAYGRARDQFTELETKMTQMEEKLLQMQDNVQKAHTQVGEALREKTVEVQKNSKLLLQIEGLKRDIVKSNDEIKECDKEIKQYQHTVMRLTRECDEAKLAKQEYADQTQKLDFFDKKFRQQETHMEKLKSKLVKPQRRAVFCQTDESGNLELQRAREEVLKSLQHQDAVYGENIQLKEALQRNSQEIVRLIEDKRELEDLIEKLNKNINESTQQVHASIQPSSSNNNNPSGSATGTLEGTRVVKNNHYGISFEDPTSEVMNQILTEKENYIVNLENEITDMRREIDKQRDQIVQHDLQSIGGMTDVNANQSNFVSLNSHNGGNQLNTHHHPQQPLPPRSQVTSGNLYQYPDSPPQQPQQRPSLQTKTNLHNPNHLYETQKYYQGSSQFQREIISQPDHAKSPNEAKSQGKDGGGSSSLGYDQYPLRLQPTTMQLSSMSKSEMNNSQQDQRDLKSPQFQQANNANPQFFRQVQAKAALGNNVSHLSSSQNATQNQTYVPGSANQLNNTSYHTGQAHQNASSFLNMNNYTTSQQNYTTAFGQQNGGTGTQGFIDQQARQESPQRY